ncbi:hypothetical protein PIB30_051381 [Stylosanthes scabra]|uniref:F-box associated beta-propeller type 1 domain-containing protein n=1 Tax=Stylosanthes scabra TaxID=79078 RepID=A0ABU6SIK0_9FABA|nr:hypothetical protein [Stylosanthes scabra]
MENNNSHNTVAELTSLLFSVRTFFEALREQSMRIKRISSLHEDVLWTIFINTEPKVAARCRTLSKQWEKLLLSEDFIMENFRATRNRKMSIIVGVGYPPTSLKSHWFLQFDAESGEQIPFNIPFNINIFGHYTMIGSDHGNICVWVPESGVHSQLLIWNPLTDQSSWVEDEAWKRRNFAVCLDAFGYMNSNMNYRILHVWKRHYWHRQLGWSLFKSEEKKGCMEGVFETEAHKIGPYPVVADGAVFWIGWEGDDLAEPTVILAFSFKDMSFYEEKIPPEVVANSNALSKFNNGVGLISYREVGFTREVVVWKMYREGHDLLI